LLSKLKAYACMVKEDEKRKWVPAIAFIGKKKVNSIAQTLQNTSCFLLGLN
jgi:hypothetical protein